MDEEPSEHENVEPVQRERSIMFAKRSAPEERTRYRSRSKSRSRSPVRRDSNISSSGKKFQNIENSESTVISQDLEQINLVQELKERQDEMAKRIENLEKRDARLYIETLQQAEDLLTEMESGYKKRIAQAEQNEAEMRDRLRRCLHRENMVSRDTSRPQAERKLLEMENELNVYRKEIINRKSDTIISDNPENECEKYDKIEQEQEIYHELHHEQIIIEDNTTGHSYKTIFKKILDSDLESVTIQDPYIMNISQIQNLVMFCEMLVKNCNSLTNIYLHTKKTRNKSEAFDQQRCLNELKDNLISYKIDMHIKFSSTLHDRQITFSNGWIVKIGRGFDFLKRVSGKFCLGMFDYDFRQCHETIIDIFHQKNVKKSLR